MGEPRKWTIDDALPTRAIYRCWDDLCVMRADDGTTRNQARQFACAENYGDPYSYRYVRAIRCWFGPWNVYGNASCVDCDCGAEPEEPGEDCTSFACVVQPRRPNGAGWTPGWAFPDA